MMKFSDPARLAPLISGYQAAFGASPERFFSAPGRTEICGNHTDHQNGRVLAAAVNLDTLAAVGPTGSREIRVLSEGYPLCCVDLDDMDPDPAEYGTTQALVRGVAAGMQRLGCPASGFDAYVTSQVLPGSGLSSSAAFEVLIGTILNQLFFGGRASAVQIAQVAQQAENTYFGKPCGLLDQMASSVGNLVEIDFSEFPFAENEKILLCSDGLSGYCTDEEIYGVISESELDGMADGLIELANGKGGRDNVTVAIVWD